MQATTECPYPGTCEFDGFRHSGNHICMRASCPYALCLGALVLERKQYAESLKTPHSGAQARESG